MRTYALIRDEVREILRLIWRLRIFTDDPQDIGDIIEIGEDCRRINLAVSRMEQRNEERRNASEVPRHE